MDILLLIRRLLLILVDANCLTDGAASVAKRLHIPSIAIRLTIIVFGASTPELTVSVPSVLKSGTDIAVGNVVGSNTLNTLAAAGCTALSAPVVITRNTLREEIPLCILSSIVLLICTNDVFLGKTPRSILNIPNGSILLYFFTVFLGHTFAIASRSTNDAQPPEEEIKNLPMWKSVLSILGGLDGLVFGGQWFVEGASNIARNLSVSESVTGLTLVTGGTSLPELATSVVATLKKNSEIAIGNVMDNNLFNILFVLGCSASTTPLQLAGISNFDLFTLVGSDVLLWFFGLFFARRTITRIEGNILVLCYTAYTIYFIYQI